MHSNLLATTFISCVLSVSALAQKSTPILIVSPGQATSCGGLTRVIEGRTISSESAQGAATALGWTWGFLSRYNVEHPKNSVAIPSEADTIFLYLEKFCREHPLEGIAAANNQLIVDLGGLPPADRQSKP